MSLSTTFLGTLVLSVAMVTSSIGVPATVPSKPAAPAPPPALSRATPCMKALMNLESSCDGMDDHMKRVMAFGLLSCHISESGRHPLVCEDAIQECTRQLDEPGFLLFTTFLQHADNVCHYLQAELWNDMSHLVALQLLDSSEEAIKTAKRTKDLQDSVIDGQHTLISMGQAALLTEQRLRAELDVASSKLAHYEEHIHNLLHSLEDNMQRDYRDITTSLDTIRGYTDALVQMSLASSGESSAIKGFLFYSLLLAAALMMSSSKRTQAARVWCVLGIASAILLELSLAQLWLGWPPSVNIALSSLLLDSVWHWRVRQFTAGAALMCVVVSALTYKPYGKLNHEMLLVLAGRLEALESRLGRVAAGRGEVDMIEDEHAVGRDSGKPDAASEGSSVAGCSEDSHPDADDVGGGRKSALGSVLSQSTITNVKTVVRVRPPTRKELETSAEFCLDRHGNSCSIRPPGGDVEKSKNFDFDRVLWVDSSQEETYLASFSPLPAKVLDGFNVTVLTYGVTGTGKTYSMLGADRDVGVFPRAVLDLFKQIKTDVLTSQAASESDSASETASRASGSTARAEVPQRQYMVTMSFLEIYNDVVKDVLNPTDRFLEVREHPETGVFVENASEIVVLSPDEAFRLLEDGERVRRIGCTQAPERSARTHSIIILTVDKRTIELVGGTEKHSVISSKFVFVDLAGSEQTEDDLGRPRGGSGAYTNKPLVALNNVILTVASGKRARAAFSESPLPFILKNSLGGKTLTVVLATVSPAVSAYDDTLETFQLIARAKAVKNDVKRNVDSTASLIKDIQAEVDAMKEQAARTPALGAKPGVEAVLPEKVVALEATIETLQRARLNDWEEKFRVSAVFKQERLKSMASDARIRSVMQTTKEDNALLLARIRSLIEERNELTGRFQVQKQQHSSTREMLALSMAKYQELYLDGGELGPHKDELETLLAAIDALQKKAESEAEALRDLKTMLRENEVKQMEQRTEAASQRMTLEDVEVEVQKVVRVEEQDRVEKELYEFQMKAMEDERVRLTATMEKERLALMDRYHSEKEIITPREHALELEVLKLRGEKAALELQVAHAKKVRELEEEQRQLEYKRAIRNSKLRELQTLKQVCEGFDEERRVMEQKYSEIAKLLQQAVQDIVFLSNRNSELEK